MQRLKLFGGLSIETDSGPLTGRAVQRRRLALLTLLAAGRSRGMSRERLIAYLWPEADLENGRRFLSDSVYRINKELGGDTILAAGDELRLAPERLPSDVAAFEDALARGDFATAIDLYAGPFLDGFYLSESAEFERWADGERDRLAREYARALEGAAVAAESAGDATSAVARWRALAEHDPYSSRVALRLMQALVAAGERAAAIQHARVHESAVTQELGTEPDAAVRDFAEALKQDRGSISPRIASGAASPAAAIPAAAPAAESEATGAAPPSSARATTARRLPALAVAIAFMAIVVAVIAVAFLRSQRDGAPAGAPGTRAIAVLPFRNVSPDRDTEYFSDGITEELIATLAQVGELRVASRTSAFAYKNRSIDVREVGRQLGVGAVVEGSVRRVGETLRITAQLIDATTGYDLWSGSYERQLDDVFAIQEEISRAIVANLVGTLQTGDRVAIVERSTRDAEAYDLYLRGRYAWHERTRDGLDRAIEYFTRAIAQETEYARAHSALADAYAVSAFYDYRPPRDAYARAEAAAQRAIELDATLAAPQATVGYIQTYYHMDWRRAEEAFRRALALDPTYSTAYQWYGNLLTVSRRFVEAERALRAAQESDPLSRIASAALCWSLYYAGRYDEALRQCQRTLAFDERFELAHLWGGWVLLELDRRDEARAWIERAAQLANESALTRLARAYALARSGTPSERAAARATVRAMEQERRSGRYVPAYEIAKVHLALGDRDAALEWLRRTVEDRSHSRAFFGIDPQLAPLRDDARFRSLSASVPSR